LSKNGSGYDLRRPHGGRLRPHGLFVATDIGSPLLSHTLFPIYVALMLWGGLYIREMRLRELVPFRQQRK
jgi:hypothetical protein